MLHSVAQMGQNWEIAILVRVLMSNGGTECFKKYQPKETWGYYKQRRTEQSLTASQSYIKL